MWSAVCIMMGVRNSLTSPGVGSDRRQQCVVQSDRLREEAVAVSFGDGADTPVPSARWHKGEAFTRAIGEIMHNAFCLTDASDRMIGSTGGWYRALIENCVSVLNSEFALHHKNPTV